MAAPRKPARKPRTPKPPGPPDGYVLFSRMIGPEQNAGLVQHLTNFIQAGASHVVVAISSPGGGVQPAFALYNTLRALPLHVTMHNIGVVQSAANVVFVGADTRLADASATFKFHQPTATLEGEYDATDLRQHTKDLTLGEKRTRRVLEGRTGMTGARIDTLKRQAETVSATGAVKLGLISGVGTFQIPEGVPTVTV